MNSIKETVSAPQYVFFAMREFNVHFIVFHLVAFILMLITYAWWKRRQTKRLLESLGLPTVFWSPRFVGYTPIEEAKKKEKHKLSSSSITRILPRMEELDGPFGMYGTVYGISTAVVHVAHPIPARSILLSTGAKKTSEKGRKGSSILSASGASKAPAYDHFKNFCGEGVFTADGSVWREKRISVMHCLLQKNPDGEGFEVKVEREAHHSANRLIRDISRMLQQQEQEGRKVPFNIVPLIQRSTVGLIYHYITHRDLPEIARDIGTSPNAHSSHPSQPHRNGITDLLSRYMVSVMDIRMIILAQSRSIWFLLPRWCYRYLSSLYQEEEKTMVAIRQFAREACQNAKPDSPLARLSKLDSHNKPQQEQTWLRSMPSTQDMPSKQMLDEAITLLFAGQDTSAATLSWTLHLLSLYPSKQAKLAKEVESVLGARNLENANMPFVSKQDVTKLKYLDAVIKESMRLYPVAPFIVRKIVDSLPVIGDEEKINDNAGNRGKATRVDLPRGSLACIWIYALHRNPKFWDRPNEFIPERWLDPDLKDIGMSNGAYMPFAIGPRNCVGQPMAHIILRSLLARLIYEFKFDFSTHEESDTSLERAADLRKEVTENPQRWQKDMQAGFTVLPRGGVYFLPEYRDSARSAIASHSK